MMWTVCHLCPYGACFVFNCYHNWSLLILRNGKGTERFLHSSEDVTQGYPIDMVTYSIGIILLIKRPKAAYPDDTYTWYADYSGALGAYGNIELYFNSLKTPVLSRRYHPKPSKIILIVHPDNIETQKLFGLCHGFKVCTGVSYLGSVIRDDKSKRDWLMDCTLKREKKICKISKKAEKHSQKSYSMMVHLIHPEWTFLHHVKKIRDMHL